MSERPARRKAAGSAAAALRRRNRELAALNTIARELNRSLDLHQALDTALGHVARLLDLRTAWIWLLDEPSGTYYLAAQRELPPALADHPERMDGEAYCYCLDTYKRGDLEGAANVNVVSCSRLWGLVDSTAGLRYHASIPLYAHGRRMGVLNVASAAWRKLSAADLDLLHTIGDLLSIAIERTRLYARSAELGAAEERSRLAREFHDTLAQRLAGVALQLESADALLEAGEGPARVGSVVRQALELVRAGLDEARRSVLDLRAAPLEGRKLPEALQALAEEVGRQGPLQVAFHAAGSRPLAPRVEVGLYRIAQEALANVLKHSAATHARVGLEVHPERVELSVEDDGRGFDPAQAPRGRFGLSGMNERARLLGGALRLRSTPGAGTCVAVTVPDVPEARPA
jgi:two-component system NarL family sensor kinase